jgi:hypothetical protein
MWWLGNTQTMADTKLPKQPTIMGLLWEKEKI